jgi:hypothetical protein
VHELPPAEEKRWVETVKTHKTLDGATVMEVLKHAEQMRHKRFKLAAIEVGYDGASGEPEAVVIIFFIGMKRLDGYSIGYDIKRNGKEIQLSVPKNPATDDTRHGAPILHYRTFDPERWAACAGGSRTFRPL